MYHLNYNITTNIIEVTFVNEVNAIDIIEFIHSVKLSTEYPKSIKVILKGQNTVSLFSPVELGTIIEESKKTIDNYDFIQLAIVINNPKSTALAMLFKNLILCPKIFVDVFSTENAARHWITI